MTKPERRITAVERAMQMAQEAKQRAQQEAADRATRATAERQHKAEHTERQLRLGQRHKDWRNHLIEEVFALNPGLHGGEPWSASTVKAVEFNCRVLSDFGVTKQLKLPHEVRYILWQTFARLVWEDQHSDEPVWQMRALYGMRLPEFRAAYDALDLPPAGDETVSDDGESDEVTQETASNDGDGYDVQGDGPDAIIVQWPTRAAG